MRAATSPIALALLALAGLAAPVSRAEAHCDTLDGPVVADARAALAAGDVTPVLKWVRAEDEDEIRTAFRKAQAARDASDAARELADLWFFETVVRVHRAGEGAPYDGLKPAGSVATGIAAADRALADGTVDGLAAELGAAVAAGVRARFAAVRQTQPHATDSLTAGRRYVAAYVEFIHYLERLHAAVAARGPSHPGSTTHGH